MDRRPLSSDERELMALPSIAPQFPVQLKNDATWNSLNGCCKGCGKDIDPALFTGRVSRQIKSAATVEASGACSACNLLTRVHYRLHDDMRITGPSGQGWATWRASQSALVSSLEGYIGKLLGDTAS